MAKISVQNTGSRELTMSRIVIITDTGAYAYVNNTATVFLPGQKKVMNIALDSNVINCASYGGKSPNRYSVFIAYDDDPITGKVFNSTNKLLPVRCSS
ncbi:Uncharacterised protein [uncultured archaeon]|nr:Uncharacterised protein [uncultured archaeon]